MLALGSDIISDFGLFVLGIATVVIGSLFAANSLVQAFKHKRLTWGLFLAGSVPMLLGAYLTYRWKVSGWDFGNAAYLPLIPTGLGVSAVILWGWRRITTAQQPKQ